MRSSKKTSTIYQRIISIVLGIVFSFVLLECIIRLSGFMFICYQDYRNRISLFQKGSYRILCLGDSVTAGQYPRILEGILNDRHIGINFSVIDKGLILANSAVILSQLENNLNTYKPDAVIAMMGTNDKEVTYYKDIPESSSWIFRHCRSYRFARLIYAHIAQKFKKKGVQSGPGIENEADAEKIIIPAVAGDLVTLNPSGSAAALNPKDGKGHADLGFFYSGQGALPEAEASFRQAIKLNPDNVAAYVGMGIVYYSQGKLRDSEIVLQKAINLNPQNDSAFIVLGWVYQLQGRFSDAGDSYKKALALNPRNEKAHSALGQLYQAQGKFDDAQASFQKVLEINPGNDWAYVKLGELYQIQGKFADAVVAFKKTIELNPSSDRAYRALALLYRQTNRPDLVGAIDRKMAQLRVDEYGALTVDSYRRLKRILDKRGIRLICMQYPMRSVLPLKRIFDDGAGVLFVDNQGVFEEASKKGDYRDYFKDMFGGDFGHCTDKGNGIMAKNIADTIIKEVFGK